MQIPANWTPLTTEHGEDTATAYLHTPEFVLQVTHQTRQTTMVQVREAASPDGYHFQNGDAVIEFGWHNTPADAFRFCEAYVASTEQFRPEKPRRLSSRYSAAVTAAYTRRAA